MTKAPKSPEKSIVDAISPRIVSSRALLIGSEGSPEPPPPPSSRRPSSLRPRPPPWASERRGGGGSSRTDPGITALTVRSSRTA
jgi:hypothetical protein